MGSTDGVKVAVDEDHLGVPEGNAAKRSVGRKTFLETIGDFAERQRFAFFALILSVVFMAVLGCLNFGTNLLSIMMLKDAYVEDGDDGFSVMKDRDGNELAASSRPIMKVAQLGIEHDMVLSEEWTATMSDGNFGDIYKMSANSAMFSDESFTFQHVVTSPGGGFVFHCGYTMKRSHWTVSQPETTYWASSGHVTNDAGCPLLSMNGDPRGITVKTVYDCAGQHSGTTMCLEYSALPRDGDVGTRRSLAFEFNKSKTARRCEQFTSVPSNWEAICNKLASAEFKDKSWSDVTTSVRDTYYAALKTLHGYSDDVIAGIKKADELLEGYDPTSTVLNGIPDALETVLDDYSDLEVVYHFWSELSAQLGSAIATTLDEKCGFSPGTDSGTWLHRSKGGTDTRRRLSDDACLSRSYDPNLPYQSCKTTGANTCGCGLECDKFCKIEITDEFFSGVDADGDSPGSGHIGGSGQCKAIVCAAKQYQCTSVTADSASDDADSLQVCTRCGYGANGSKCFSSSKQFCNGKKPGAIANCGTSC